MDPGIAKLVSLPFFSSALPDVLISYKLTSVELFLAFQAWSGEDFVCKFLALAPVLGPTNPAGLPCSITLAVLETVLEELNTLWYLIDATKNALLEREARLVGFGLARHAVRPLAPQLPVPLKFRKLEPKVVAPAALKFHAPVVSALMEAEILAKAKWINRLERIARRAGCWSGFFSVQQGDAAQNVLTEGENALLRKAVLARGAFRTLAVHTGHFERFQQWAHDSHLAFFPITVDLVLKYCLFLDSRCCGPTVIPSVRAALKWVGAKLQIAMPDLSEPRLISIEKKVVEERSQELKEAVPFPLLMVCLLELFVLRNQACAPVSAFFAGWILCMIFASLRFDDALHVRPDSLEFKEGVLFGVCWQTKVERKRRGSRFAVPQIGFAAPSPGQKPWLQIFLDLSSSLAPADRDFWMYEVDVDRFGLLTLSSRIATYSRSLKILKFLLIAAIDEAVLEGCALVNDAKELALRDFVLVVTLHSCKVTMIDAAVHAGEDPLPISIQAHHANTDLVIKYTRNRTEVPLQMVSRLAKAFQESWAPQKDLVAGEVTPDDDFSDDGFAEEPVAMFYIKRSSLKPNLSSFSKQRFHVLHCSELGTLACKKHNVSSCEPVGPVLPDDAIFCKACKRARPDLFSVHN